MKQVRQFVLLVILALAACSAPVRTDPHAGWVELPGSNAASSEQEQACWKLLKEKYVRNGLFFEPGYCFVNDGNNNYFLVNVK